MKCIDDGATVATPVHLDGTGKQLATVTPESVVHRDRHAYDEKPFSGAADLLSGLRRVTRGCRPASRVSPPMRGVFYAIL
jgi:hypothetical protein